MSETTSQYAFVANGSGLFSRNVFESSQGTGFNISIRDFSVPPRTGPLTLQLTGAAALEMRSGQGIVKVGEESQQLHQDSIISVPMAAAIELTNPDKREFIVRVYILEAK